MIELVMGKNGFAAHIKDRHVTWCGSVAETDRPVPARPRVCPGCIRQCIADGAATDLEMGKLLTHTNKS